jgi:hypothetical protein
MASVETDAAPRSSDIRLLLAAGGVVALGAAAMLWMRFGEAVYASSIMNAILACF